MKNRIGRFGRGGRASRRHKDKAAEIRRRIEIFAAATGVAVETLEDLVWEVLDWFRAHGGAKVRLEGIRAIYTGDVKDQPWKAVFDVVGAYGLPPQGVKKVLEEHLRGERDQLPPGYAALPGDRLPRGALKEGPLRAPLLFGRQARRCSAPCKPARRS